MTTETRDEHPSKAPCPGELGLEDVFLEHAVERRVLGVGDLGWRWAMRREVFELEFIALFSIEIREPKLTVLLPLVLLPHVLGALEAEEEPACQEDDRDGRKRRVVGDGVLSNYKPFALLRVRWKSFAAFEEVLFLALGTDQQGTR